MHVTAESKLNSRPAPVAELVSWCLQPTQTCPKYSDVVGLCQFVSQLLFQIVCNMLDGGFNGIRIKGKHRYRKGLVIEQQRSSVACSKLVIKWRWITHLNHR